MVEVVALVGENGLLAQYGESVGKSAGDEELALVLFAQFDGKPLTKGGTLFAQIDSYVEHTSDGAADQLSLAIRRTLEMEATYDTIAGA